MPVVNDTPGAWEKIRAEGERLAAGLNIPREILFGFFNENGRFPTSIPELEAWGNKPDPIYGIQRRHTDGSWYPITPGPNPMRANLPAGTADGTRGAWPIQNAEDADIQRFKDWNPAIMSSFGQQSVAPAPQRSAFTAPGAQTGRVAGGPRLTAQGVDVSSPAYQAANPSGQPYGSFPQPDPNQGYNANGPAPGAGAPPNSTVAGGGDYGQINVPLQELNSLAEFRNRELATLRLPQFEFQKDYSNRQLAQQNAQFLANLQQQAEEIKARYGEAAAQRHVQEVLGRGQLALGGLGLASDEATRRMQIGLGGASQAGTEALGRISAGSQAASAADRMTMDRANLLATLRGPANAFQQMKVAGLTSPNLARALAGEAGVAGYQAPQADPRAAGLGDVGASDTSEAQRIQLDYARQGLDPYASPSAQQALAYGRQGMDPYGNSPTIQGALGLAAPNAQYAIPGSATSQIPGLAQHVNAGLEQLRQTNYGLPADPGRGVNDAIQALRGDPDYLATMQRASAGDQQAVQRMRQLEGDAVARATGLDPQQGLQLVQQWRSQPGMRTAAEIEASVNPLVADVRLRKEAGVLTQIAGLDPAQAAEVVRELRSGTNVTGQPSTPEQIERILAGRLGQQGLGPQVPPGTGAFGPPGQAQSGFAMAQGDQFQAPAMGMASGAGTSPILRRGGPTMQTQAGGPTEIASGASLMGGMRRASSPMGAAAPVSGAPMPGQAPQQLQAPGQPVPDAAAVARGFTGGRAPNQINSAAFGRLPRSAQQFTLGAYESMGYDPNDVLETIQRTLPKAVGARRGFVAPAA